MINYPVVAGAIGEDDQGAVFIEQVMSFLDHPANGLPPQSYLAWVWNTDQTIYDLIKNYTGEPTKPYGKAYMDHLLALRPQPTPGQSDIPYNRSYPQQLVGDRRAAPGYDL